MLRLRGVAALSMDDRFTVANMAIVPMQDVLELDSWARFNRPGIAGGNWSWRFKKEDLTEHLAHRLFETAKMFGR